MNWDARLGQETNELADSDSNDPIGAPAGLPEFSNLLGIVAIIAVVAIAYVMMKKKQ